MWRVMKMGAAWWSDMSCRWERCGTQMGQRACHGFGKLCRTARRYWAVEVLSVVVAGSVEGASADGRGGAALKKFAEACARGVCLRS
jgi:hypothetical protein